MKSIMMMVVFVLLAPAIAFQNLYGQSPTFQPQIELTGVIANYPLRSDGNDSTGQNKPMELKRVQFHNGGIYSDGTYDPDGGQTAMELALNVKQFAIRAEFMVYEIQDKYNKAQPVFMFLDRWMGVTLEKDGTVSLLYDNAQYIHSNVRYTLNVWHEVILTYDQSRQMANIYFDGTLACTLNNFAKERGTTRIGLTNFSNGMVFKGWIRNLSAGTGLRRTATTQTSGASAVEDQYWDAVKNSTRVQDFQSYLDTYPSGKYVPLARLKINQLGGSTPPPTTQSDAQFLNSWAATTRAALPFKLGDFEIIKAYSRCPAGCEERDSPTYLVLEAKSLVFYQQSVTIAQMERSLKPLLLSDYCSTEGKRRGITLGAFVRDMNSTIIGNFWIYPKDCP